jgi:hypothetical protein
MTRNPSLEEVWLLKTRFALTFDLSTLAMSARRRHQVGLVGVGACDFGPEYSVEQNDTNVDRSETDGTDRGV